MRPFSRPGGWRLWPEPDYLAARLEEADDPEEFTEVFVEVLRDGREALNRLEDLRAEIRDVAQDERDLELDLHRLREQQKVRPFDRPYSDDDLDELISERSAHHARLVERRKKLQEERDELADHVARNYSPVAVERDALDLSPPNVDEVKRQVGEPV